MTAPATCVVSSTLYGPDGAGYAGALVRARVALSGPVAVGSGLATGYAGTTYTAAGGTWSLTLMQGLTVWIEIPAAGVDHYLVVPAAATATLDNLGAQRVSP